MRMMEFSKAREQFAMAMKHVMIMDFVVSSGVHQHASSGVVNRIVNLSLNQIGVGLVVKA